MKYGTTGTVIQATLRSQDLLTAFARELEDLVTKNPELPLTEREKLTKLVWDAREVKDFDSELAADLVNELIDALTGFAPPGNYFGAHPDDGADFGFWQSE